MPTEASARPYDLIVLDWDGTVMDSLGVIVACAQEGARDLELEVPAENAIRDLVGLKLSIIAARLFPQHEDLHVRWIERYSFHWINTFLDRLRLLPTAREAVERLHREGYYLAVATGKSRRGLNRDFDSTGLGKLFLASRTVDEAPSKPSPVMLLDIVDELGMQKNRTLMVGDTTHDLQMAVNGGIDAVGVLSGSHDEATLSEHSPVAVLDDLGALPDWLASKS